MAIVLIAGLGTPAFAQSSNLSEFGGEGVPGDIVSATDVPNHIFDGGPPDQINANDMTVWVQAEDFVLANDEVLGDVHFWTGETGAWDGTLQWFLFLDNAGQPAAAPFAQGSGILIDKVLTGGTVAGLAPEFEYWMDLDTPVPLSAGVTYYLGLNLGSPDGMIFWETTSAGFGSTGWESLGGTFDNWFDNGEDHAFFLTKPSVAVVGGELLPIDTSALLLAGAQMNAAWMIPVIVSGIGFAIVIARKF